MLPLLVLALVTLYILIFITEGDVHEHNFMNLLYFN